MILYEFNSLSDPTWTVENVLGVMEKMTNDRVIDVYKELIGGSVLEEIKHKCFTDRELMHTFIDIYVNCKTDSSWEEIVRGLYLVDETAAVEKAQSFLNLRGTFWFTKKKT